jgi:hypothetical protein
VSDFFPIIKVPDDAVQSDESMGTKYKFWYQHPDLGKCLFKKARPQTGEDWAEKLAAEFASKLELPHVNYEIAVLNEEPGCICPSMLPPKAMLLHGNEILSILVSSYPTSESYGVRQHTLDLVIQAIDAPYVHPPYNWKLPTGINTAIDTFIGYLMLDTWIGNSDRHHENWGFIFLDNQFYLAPSYDHGSSLGRELQDSKRSTIISNNTLQNYIERSRSAMYGNVNNQKALPNLEVFRISASRFPISARIWLQKLAQISSDNIEKVLLKVPENRLSPVARQFIYQILLQNQIRLLNLHF